MQLENQAYYRIDLHTHSTASDGTLSPTELVRLAYEKKVMGLSLTDHDTAEGNDEAAAEAAILGVKFIPGIEVSCDYRDGNIHILGYWINPHHTELNRTLEDLIDYRNNRNHKIIERFQHLGVNIDYAEIAAIAGNDVVGRPHFARILVEKGYAKDVKDAFERFLGAGKAAYMPKKRMTVEQGIALIRKAGGIPVLAHPVQYGFGELKEYFAVIEELKAKGVAGLEVFYSTNLPEDTQMFLKLALEFDLAITGGSDFHGSVKPDVELGRGTNGNIELGMDVLLRLEERYLKYREACIV